MSNINLISREWKFCTELCTNEATNGPFLEGLDWSTLESAKVNRLERPFEEDEVKNAIWMMDKEKALESLWFQYAFFFFFILVAFL